MARPEITGRKVTTNPQSRGDPKTARGPPPLAMAAYTIAEFCTAHRISRAHYYNMRRLGIGPDEGRAGDRVFITYESAARWRAEREEAAPAIAARRRAARKRAARRRAAAQHEATA